MGPTIFGLGYLNLNFDIFNPDWTIPIRWGDVLVYGPSSGTMYRLGTRADS